MGFASLTKALVQLGEAVAERKQAKGHFQTTRQLQRNQGAYTKELISVLKA